MKFCPHCGNQADDSAKVCGHCGTPFAQPAQPEAPAQPVQPEAPAQPAQPQFQQPVQPEAPAQPAQPEAPAQPAQPQFQQPVQTEAPAQPAQPQYQQPVQPEAPAQPAQPQYQYQQPAQQGGFAPVYGQPQPAKKKTGLIIGVIAAVAVIAIAVVLIIVLAGGTKPFTLEEGAGTWEAGVSIDMGKVLKEMGNTQAAEMLEGQNLKFIFTLDISSSGSGTMKGQVDTESFKTVMRNALKKSGLDDSMIEMTLGQLDPNDLFDSRDLSSSVTIKGDMLYGENSSDPFSNGAKLEFKGGKLVLNKPEGIEDKNNVMLAMFPMTFTKK